MWMKKTILIVLLICLAGSVTSFADIVYENDYEGETVGGGIAGAWNWGDNGTVHNAVYADYDGNIVVDEEPTIVPWQSTAAASPVYSAYWVSVCGYAGFQIGGAFSAARICNIETALDDDDIYNALSLFPSARQPNLIVMNRKSLRLLRESRTAVNPTGAAAPRPTDIEGIPIVVTDSVKSTEAVET